jgi:hypothetical protein
MITCPNCGKSFTIIWTSNSGSGEKAFQHSTGCMKMVKVKYVNGQIVQIR